MSPLQPSGPRRRSRLAGALLAAAALALGGSQLSCAASASALVIESFLGLSITAGSSATPGTCVPGVMISSGTIDVDRPNCCGYAVGVEMINNLLEQTDTNVPPLTVNQHNVTITNVTVSYKFIPDPGSPSVTIPDANMPVSASILSGGGTAEFITPVLTVANGAALNPAGGDPVTGGVVATMTFHGKTTDGTPLTTSPIDFPITVCKDCLPSIACSGGTVQTCTADTEDQSDGAICVPNATTGG